MSWLLQCMTSKGEHKGCMNGYLRAVVEGVRLEPGLPVSYKAHCGSQLAGPVLGAGLGNLPVQVSRVHQSPHTCTAHQPSPASCLCRSLLSLNLQM